MLTLISEKDHEKRRKRQFVFYNDTRVYRTLLSRGLVQHSELPLAASSHIGKTEGQIGGGNVHHKSCDFIRNRSMDNLSKGFLKWSRKKHLNPIVYPGNATPWMCLLTVNVQQIAELVSPLFKQNKLSPIPHFKKFDVVTTDPILKQTHLLHSKDS